MTTDHRRWVLQEAHDARLKAHIERDRAATLCRQSNHLLGRTLVLHTDVADRHRELSPLRVDRLARLSKHVGRDPAIEEAKHVLRQRYDITGSQAFELLRHISQTKNRKLADVAKRVLTESERATE